MALFKKFFRDRRNLKFVQIGANDGIQADFVRERVKKFKWTGVLVEPIPYVFEKLIKNYRKCEGLIFENCAIAESSGDRDFYVCKDNEVSSGLELIHPKAQKYNAAGTVEKITVPCMTFHELLDKHGITHLDVVVIDCEGYDYKIVQSIDFSRIKPKVLIYESEQMPERKKVAKMLKSVGYKLRPFSQNTVAYL